MRVIVLSLLLGDSDFGIVATLLLLAALFAEFGTLGFGQLVYNQPLFSPGRRNWRAHRVALFLLSGMAMASAISVIVSLLLYRFTPFNFAPLWLTLWCAAMNSMIISACRAAASQFIHPAGYAIKAVIVSIDIVILGFIGLSLENMALWGEVAAFPALLLYAWHIGILRRNCRIAASVLSTIRKNWRLGLKAIISSATGIVFFNQERILGAAFLTFEQMGILTKILMPKIIAAQGSFLFGVHFHRWIVSLDGLKRNALIKRMNRWEIWITPMLIVVLVSGGWITVQFIDLIYEISISLIMGMAITLLALAFLINPYAIILQANNHFTPLAKANLLAVLQFAAACLLWHPEVEGVLIASAASAFTWFLVVRLSAVQLHR